MAIIIAVFFLGSSGGFFYFKHKLERPAQSTEPQQEKNAYLSFLSEVYDKIMEKYWDNIGNAQLVNLFKLGAEKLAGTQYYLKSEDKQELLNALQKTIKELPDEKKKEFTAKLAAIVLANLNPAGRSGLFTSADEKNLQNRVQNVNPEANLYKDLGLEKGASEQKIAEVYDQKSAELKKKNTLEAKQELEKIEYAKQVLTNKDSKQKYDASGAEPTVFYKALNSDIAYIYLKSFSPVSFDEFIKAAQDLDKGNLNTLILDLRSNVGGSIDILPYFLGPFIGQDQYAYEFMHQGERTPFKTQFGWLSSLVRYKKTVVLIDDQAQSTAEMMTAVLKKYNVGIIIGTKTRGWGTVEKVFPIEHQIDSAEKFSMFIVHSLMLRDDNQPIEGKGVDPTISISDPKWKDQLFEYFRYKELGAIIDQIWKKDPGKI